MRFVITQPHIFPIDLYAAVEMKKKKHETQLTRAVVHV